MAYLYPYSEVNVDTSIGSILCHLCLKIRMWVTVHVMMMPMVARSNTYLRSSQGDCLGCRNCLEMYRRITRSARTAPAILVMITYSTSCVIKGTSSV